MKQVLTITQDNETGEIVLEMSEGMSRMHVRALLTGALSLVDSDMIAESLAAKMMALAAQSKKKIVSL